MSHLSDEKNPSLAWIIKEVINTITPSLSNWVTDGTRHPVMEVRGRCFVDNYLYCFTLPSPTF